MGQHLNDPKINRKYNYLYKITNTINGKIYIGVHRTDKINKNPEKIEKMAAKHRGMKRSDEARQHMREAPAAYQQRRRASMK